MMTNAKKQKLFKIICHTIFILGLFWFFRLFSFMRPASYGALYKEFLAALLLLLMLYVNYFVLIPQFYLKRNYNVFIILSLTSVLLATAMEMILVTPNIINCYPSQFTKQEIRNCTLMHSLFVGGRNVAFLLFCFVIRIFETERETLEKERIAMAQNKGVICVPNGKDAMETICLSDIFYIMHERNYTYIQTLDGKQYRKYISLSNIEDILPDKLFLRINRFVIIPVCRIARYSQDSITISCGNPAQEKTFPLSEKYMPDIKDFFASVGGLNSKNDGLNGCSGGLNEGVKKADLEEFMDSIAHNEDLLNICRIIAKDPSVTMKSLSDQLGVSLKTIERRIKILKDKDVLQHSGAKKNGGYVFSPSSSPSVLSWLAGEHKS